MFGVEYLDRMYEINEDALLCRLIEQLSCTDELVLHSIAFPIEYFQHEIIKGVKLRFRSLINDDTPYIYAKYQGETISVRIDTLEVTGTIRSKNKTTEIIKYIKKNKDLLLHKFSDFANGLYIDLNVALDCEDSGTLNESKTEVSER